MRLEKLNKLLENFNNIENNSLLKFISRENVHMGVSDSSYSDGVQGEEDNYYKIFKIDGESEFLRVEYYTDSYGDNEAVRGVSFVSPVEKVINSFEPVK